MFTNHGVKHSYCCYQSEDLLWSTLEGTQCISQAVLYSTGTTGTSFSHWLSQCGSTVPTRRESENSVDPAVRQAEALCAEKTAPHSPAVSQPSPLLASHKSVPTSFIPSKLIV